MLTREQWENLARFAGVHVHHFDSAAGKLVLVNPDTDDDGYHWQPDILWADFGPLFVLIVRWKSRADSRGFSACLLPAVNSFYDALIRGTEQELMKAGCELASQIGATMTALAADKETP